MGIEKNLVHRAKKGDILAFEELISGYEKKVYNTVYRFFNNKEDAMDITQEIFIKIYVSMKNFKESSSFSTWLYRIAVNTCIDFFRKQKEIVVPINDEISDSMVTKIGIPQRSPEEIAESNEVINIIEDAINSLPEEQRICIILRDIQGFSYLEISDILNCSLGTVKSRISRGRRILRKILIDKELFTVKGV